ncbi:MAG: Hpt domain-containing protein [Bacteroidota bacterium]
MKKILYLAQQEAYTRELVQKLDPHPDIQLCVAWSLEEATRMAGEEAFQVVLSEPFFPEAFRPAWMKASGSQLIWISDWPLSTEIKNLQDKGGQNFLIHPIELEELEAILRSIAGPAPEEPLFDLTYLKSLSDGDKNFELEVFELFLEEVPPSITELKGFIGKRDWSGVAETVHRLSSKIRILGMGNLRQMARNIERHARRSTSLEETMLRTQDFIVEMERSLIQVQKLSSQLKTQLS